MQDKSWIQNELSDINVRDDRIVSRLIKTTTILSEHPNVSIPEACESWKDTTLAVETNGVPLGLLNQEIWTRDLEENKKLIDEIKNAQVGGEVIIVIPRNTRDNIDPRDAVVSIKYCPVTLTPPVKRSSDKSLNNLPLYCNSSRRNKSARRSYCNSLEASLDDISIQRNSNCKL